MTALESHDVLLESHDLFSGNHDLLLLGTMTGSGKHCLVGGSHNVLFESFAISGNHDMSDVWYIVGSPQHI